MLKITYHTQNTSNHNDLSIVFDELDLTLIADSYYLAIDNSFLPGDASEIKVILVLQRMVNSWHQLVSDLANNQVVFLPFDFSDQYLGCIRVEQIEDEIVSVCYGFTTSIEGYAIVPSSPQKISLPDKDFEVESGVITFGKDVMLAFIEKCLNR